MKMNKSSEIQSIIKNEREKQGVSIHKLAEQIGYTDRSIMYWDKGERTIGLDAADAALRALGITITLGGKNENQQR